MLFFVDKPALRKYSIGIKIEERNNDKQRGGKKMNRLTNINKLAWRLRREYAAEEKVDLMSIKWRRCFNEAIAILDTGFPPALITDLKTDVRNTYKSAA